MLKIAGIRKNNSAYSKILPVNFKNYWHLLVDVKTISELELQKLKNLDSLVINALRYESHPSHLNVQEALEIVDTIKPKNTFFTHISHNMGFHEEVCDKLPDSVSLAYDGLVLEIN